MAAVVMGYPHANVRFRDGGWEMRCPDCAARHREERYWPLTLEFWVPAHGMTRCRACWQARKAATARRSRRDPERRTRDAARCRDRRRRAKLAAFAELRRAAA